MEQFIFPLLILLLAVPMFLSIRNQKRQQRQQQELQSSIGVGDRVMTTSGLFGTVVGTTDDSVDIEIADGMVTTWLKAAVREKINPTPEAEEPAVVEDTTSETTTSETTTDAPNGEDVRPVEAEKNAR